MDLNEYIKRISEIKLEKNVKLALLIIYAVVMFLSIESSMGIITFILLFAVTPIAIYIFVKKVFLDEEK